MQTTMNLLGDAEKVRDLSAWARELGLSKQALYNCKYREHLSPAIAGAMAEQLGQDVDQWIVIAALESEKDSSCKDRMVKRLKNAVRSYIKRKLISAFPGPSHKRAKDT